MTAALKLLVIFLLFLSIQGCATTYIPVSWGLGNRVQDICRSDRTLATLLDRYDPERQTLRLGGRSFDDVMMPAEVQNHLGAYRQDTRQIYRNLYRDYNEHELRDLLVHELAHHIWFNFMTAEQRQQWGTHLDEHTTPVGLMVRRAYRRPREWDGEDFAFTLQYARRCDVQELAKLKLISDEERDRILQQLPTVRHGIEPPQE